MLEGNKLREVNGILKKKIIYLKKGEDSRSLSDQINFIYFLWALAFSVDFLAPKIMWSYEIDNNYHQNKEHIVLTVYQVQF